MQNAFALRRLAAFSAAAALSAALVAPAFAQGGAPISYATGVSSSAPRNGGYVLASNVSPMTAPAETVVIDLTRPAASAPITTTTQAATPAHVVSAASPAAAPVGGRPAWLERERVGAPYQINGRWYAPTAEPNYEQIGTASWYGPTFHGRPTATGETYDQEAMTAAHPTLPIPSLVQVTNLENGREVIVRVNDRGPFVDDRLIDLSHGAAQVLGFADRGTTRVHVRYLGPAPRRVSAAQGAPSAAPPPPAPQTRVSLASASPGGFSVQAGAFSEQARAQAARDALADLGDTDVEMVERAGRTLYRVRVVGLASREAAHQVRAMAESRGYPGASLSTP